MNDRERIGIWMYLIALATLLACLFVTRDILLTVVISLVFLAALDRVLFSK
jgi:predicted PurR-regulated permease PerM